MSGINNMQNLKKSEKSRGIVIFANNTDTVDYVGIAELTGKLASQTLGIPYTIITSAEQDYVNQRYDVDTGNFVQWKNAGRYQAYELSPYDETLVIDADLLVFDPVIGTVFELDNWDWQIMRDVKGLTQVYPRTMGINSLPYVWATAFAFRKTETAAMFFDLVRRVQENYAFYHSLFNIEQRNFRNDYAFAIADMIMTAYKPEGQPALLGPMLHIDCSGMEMDLTSANFFRVSHGTLRYVVPRSNLHIMSKEFLQSKQFREFMLNELA
jgi:hypothetical protein